MRPLIAVFLLCLIGRSAMAQVLTQELPEGFDQNYSNLTNKGTGSASLTQTKLTDTLPKNPAYLGIRRAPKFTAQVATGNGYKAFETSNKLLNEPVSREYLKSLFSDSNVIEAEGAGELTFQANNFGARYTPIRFTYFSVMRDVSFPRIALHVMQEKAFTFQTGYKVTRGAYAGLQTRMVERRFIHKEFALYDVLLEEPGRVVQPQDQKAVYIEPGAAYFFDLPWKPRVSAVVSNTGFIDRQYEEFGYRPGVDLGLGAEAPAPYGALEFGVDAHSSQLSQKGLEAFKLGSAYTLGATQLLFGLNSESVNGGVVFGFSSLNVGIVYSSTRIPGRGQDEYNNTLYTQFAYQM